jgi:hypothetical protein
VDRDSSVGIATRCGLDGPGIELRVQARFAGPVQKWVPSLYPRGGGHSEREVALRTPLSSADVKERTDLPRILPPLGRHGLLKGELHLYNYKGGSVY